MRPFGKLPKNVERKKPRKSKEAIWKRTKIGKEDIRQSAPSQWSNPLILFMRGRWPLPPLYFYFIHSPIFSGDFACWPLLC